MSYDRGPPKDRVPISAGPANCKRATGRAADTATEIAGGETQLFCSGGKNSEALLWKTLTRCCSGLEILICACHGGRVSLFH